MLIEAAIIFELVGQIENDVRVEAFQLLPEQIEVIEYGEMLGWMSQRAQSSEDVCFRLPVIGLHFLAQVLVDRGRPDRVEQSKDLDLFLHVTWSV